MAMIGMPLSCCNFALLYHREARLTDYGVLQPFPGLMNNPG
jgi:hypothetical protein